MEPGMHLASLHRSGVSVAALLVFVLLSAGAQLPAQERKATTWHADVLVGAPWSSLRFEGPNTPTEVTPRRGLTFGAELGRSISERWAWSVGALPTERRTAWRTSDAGAPVLHFNSWHLDVPLLIRRSLMTTRTLDVQLLGGVVLTSNGSGEVVVPGPDEILDVIALRRLELSGTIGAQLQHNARFPIFARVQYQHGLTRLTERDPSARYRTLGVLAGTTVWRW
jgi:hypothetical protein